MEINYINSENNQDAVNLCGKLIHALFEVENENVENYHGNATITVSLDGSPAYYAFDYAQAKCGNIGLRHCAKSAGEAFFGRKPDVAKVAELTESLYLQPSGINLFPEILDKPNGVTDIDFNAGDLLNSLKSHSENLIHSGEKPPEFTSSGLPMVYFTD